MKPRTAAISTKVGEESAGVGLLRYPVCVEWTEARLTHGMKRPFSRCRRGDRVVCEDTKTVHVIGGQQAPVCVSIGALVTLFLGEEIATSK